MVMSDYKNLKNQTIQDKENFSSSVLNALKVNGVYHKKAKTLKEKQMSFRRF